MKSKLQTTLFGDSFQSTKTNKKQFLEKMDSLIPWQDWVSIIDPIYYEGKVGQKPYPIELMLRIISRGSPQWGYYRKIQKSADKARHR